MTDKLEGDKYITLHMVWPIYLELFGVLAEDPMDFEEESNVISKMKKAGRLYVEKIKEDMQPTFYHKTMTFLHPAMKKLRKISSTEQMELHQNIERYIDGEGNQNPEVVVNATQAISINLQVPVDKPVRKNVDRLFSDSDFEIFKQMILNLTLYSFI